MYLLFKASEQVEINLSRHTWEMMEACWTGLHHATGKEVPASPTPGILRELVEVMLWKTISKVQIAIWMGIRRIR